MDRFLVRLKGLFIPCYIFMVIAEWVPNNIIDKTIDMVSIMIFCFCVIIIVFFTIYAGFSIIKMIISGEE